MRDIVYVSLRLPRPLHDALVRLAESEHRSMHGQVVHLIEQATGKVDTVRRRSRRAAPARQDGGEG